MTKEELETLYDNRYTNYYYSSIIKNLTDEDRKIFENINKEKEILKLREQNSLLQHFLFFSEQLHQYTTFLTKEELSSILLRKFTIERIVKLQRSCNLNTVYEKDFKSLSDEQKKEILNFLKSELSAPRSDNYKTQINLILNWVK